MYKFLCLISLFGVISPVSGAFDAADLENKPFSSLSPVGVCECSSRREELPSITYFPFLVNVKSLAADGQTFIESRFPIHRDTSVKEFKCTLKSALKLPANARIMWKGVQIMKTSVNLITEEFITLASLFNGEKSPPPPHTLEVKNDGREFPVCTAMLPSIRGNIPLLPLGWIRQHEDRPERVSSPIKLDPIRSGTPYIKRVKR
jgi:hypothetical protein